MATVIGKKYTSFFQKRFLKFEFIGGQDEKGNQIVFSPNGDIDLVLYGFRSTVDIEYTGGTAQPTMKASITNLPVRIANKISTLGLYNKVAMPLCNKIIVYASSDHSPEDNPLWIKMFEGSILKSYTDYNAAPNVVTYIEALTMGGYNLIASPSISFSGKIPAVDVVQAIVASFKSMLNSDYQHTQPSKEGQISVDKRSMPIIEVINDQVTTSLNNPNYHGDIQSQLDQCAHDGNFKYTVKNGILYMSSKDNDDGDDDLPNKSYPLFTASTGMIGYPQYTDNGVMVSSICKPFLVFGEPIQIVSVYEPANGIWRSMVSMRHELSEMVPNGPWRTHIEMTKFRWTKAAGTSQ